MNYFVHNGRLPTCNEYTKACRQNKYAGANMKREAESALLMSIQRAMMDGQLKPVDKPVTIEMIWHESNYKRDPDNIAFAKKFIFDALVTARIIPNDSAKFINGFTDHIEHNRDEGVIVSIKTAKDNKTGRLAHDDLYRQVAATIARGSGCLKRQYGAVIVKDDRIVAEGYNAPIAGKEHCQTCKRMNKPHNSGEYSDCPSIHAEANAIGYCNRNGIDLNGAVIYLAGYDNGYRIIDPQPCPICAELIQRYGLSVRG